MTTDALGYVRDEWDGYEPPCEVCGNDVDGCTCPECPVCHEHGNPACYGPHIGWAIVLNGITLDIFHEKELAVYYLREINRYRMEHRRDTFARIALSAWAHDGLLEKVGADE